MYLTKQDMRSNKFEGVDRELIEPGPKVEKWASSSSDSMESMTGEEKVEEIVTVREKKERKERKKYENDQMFIRKQSLLGGLFTSM